MNVNDGAMEAAAASGRPIPRDAEGPVFREPWEAEAFAMAVALHEARLFTWSEWAEALSRRIAGAAASRSGAEDSCYAHWLAALEDLVVEKGAASRAQLNARKAAWGRAAEATPHGAPILLANDPEAASASNRPLRVPGGDPAAPQAR